MITWQEEDIEDYLYRHIDSVLSPSCFVVGRQVNIGVGIIDLLVYDQKNKILLVLEIKNHTIDEKAITQIMRYMQGVVDYLRDEEAADIEITDHIYDIRGVLVGPDIRDDAVQALRFASRKIDFCKIEVSIEVDAEFVSFERNKEAPSYNPKPFIEMIRNTFRGLPLDEEDENELLLPSGNKRF